MTSVTEAKIAATIRPPSSLTRCSRLRSRHRRASRSAGDALQVASSSAFAITWAGISVLTDEGPVVGPVSPDGEVLHRGSTILRTTGDDEVEARWSREGQAAALPDSECSG